jgi:hypothetical protein
MERNQLIKLLTIYLVSRRQIVDSSYFFHQIFTKLGIFVSVEKLIKEYSSDKFLRFQEEFDNNSGFIRNISLDLNGIELLKKQPIENYLEEMNECFDNFEFLKTKILNQE